MKILKLIKAYIIKFPRQFTFFIVSSLIVWSISLVNPYIMGSLIDRLVTSGDKTTIYTYALVIAALSALNILFQFIVNLTSTKLNGNIAFELSYTIYDRLKKAPLTFFKSVDSAYLSTRINEDCNNLIMFFTSNCISIFTNILTLIFGFTVVFYINIEIAFTFLLIIPIYILIYLSFRKSLFKSNYILIEKRNKYFSVMTEQFKLIKFIKINALFDEVNHKLRRTFHDVYSEVLSNFRINYLFSNLNSIIIVVSNIIILLYGGILVIENRITIGEFTILNTYFTLILSATKYFVDLGRSYQQILVSVNRIEELMQVDKEANGLIIPSAINSVKIENLSFSFNERHLIQNFSYKFEKGNIYCLIGENGCGKSTLLNLLSNIYQIRNGKVSYNNEDIRNIDMYHLRKNEIAYTTQTPILVTGSIYDNLTYGIDKNCYTDNTLRNFCDMFNLSQTIKKTPNGLDTIISDDYEHFSGGEKQKIAVIRALLKDSPIIILDEPTSAFDKNSTLILKDYLNKVKSNKIIILITHDQTFIDDSFKTVNLGTNVFYESTS